MDLITTLERLGLTEKEAKAYLVLLQQNEATATKIAEKANIDRTLTYQIMNRLIAKGLVSYSIKNNVRFYYPASPEKLMEELKEKEKELSKAMPDLIGLAKMREEDTKVEIYRGKKGLRTVLKDIVRSGKDYIAFGEQGRFQEALPFYSKQFIKQIERAGIHEKVLAKKGSKVIKAKTSKIKFVPKEVLSPATVVIYSDKIVNLVWTKPYYAVVTKNREIADSYKSYFNVLWKKIR
jgi:sugar-specific transcriptional regulator TrmB